MCVVLESGSVWDYNMSNIFPSLNRKTSLWKSTSQKQIRSSPWNRLQSRTKSHGRQLRAEFQWVQNWSLTNYFPQRRRRLRQKQQTVYEKKTLTFLCTKKETYMHTHVQNGRDICTEWRQNLEIDPRFIALFATI